MQLTPPPKNVDRECPICGDIVERDTPRWFDLRKSPPVSANLEVGSDYLTLSRVEMREATL
jgi:hypothetical protein